MGEGNNDSGKGILALLITLIVILLALICYKFIYINIEIDGESMEPTLYENDQLVINRLKMPDYDDIMVINIEEQSKWIIKRVIGKEGDVIELRNGAVYRKTLADNDFILVENNGYETIGATDPDAVNQLVTWTVGKDEFFFLGDHRDNSYDSRHYGLRKLDDVVGVVTDWSFEKKGFWYSFNKVINYPSQIFSSCRSVTGE